MGTWPVHDGFPLLTPGNLNGSLSPSLSWPSKGNQKAKERKPEGQGLLSGAVGIALLLHLRRRLYILATCVCSVPGSIIFPA